MSANPPFLHFGEYRLELNSWIRRQPGWWRGGEREAAFITVSLLAKGCCVWRPDTSTLRWAYSSCSCLCYRLMYMAGYCSGNQGKHTVCLVMGEPEQACPSFLSSQGRKAVAFSAHVPSASSAAAQAIDLRLFFAVTFVLPYWIAVCSEIEDLYSGMQVVFCTCCCCSVTCDFLWPSAKCDVRTAYCLLGPGVLGLVELGHHGANDLLAITCDKGVGGIASEHFSHPVSIFCSLVGCPACPLKPGKHPLVLLLGHGDLVCHYLLLDCSRLLEVRVSQMNCWLWGACPSQMQEEPNTVSHHAGWLLAQHSAE